MELDDDQVVLSVCKICKKDFINELLRIQHIRYSHPESLQFACKICGIKCETQASVTRHIRDKHKKKKRDGSDVAKQLLVKKSASLSKGKSVSATDKVSPQWRARVELACMRYAMVHGKHKAQLRYAQLEPACRIGWRRLTELLSAHKQDKVPKKASYLYKRGRKGNKKDVHLTVPADIKSECGKYGVIHGPDNAQWEFTLRYPTYIFSYASVRNWCEAEREKFGNDSTMSKQFGENLVASINDALTKSLSISNAEITILSKVKEYNDEVKDKKMIVDGENAVDEWLHTLNYYEMERKKSGSLINCTCGNVYKTERELAKHKPKCWVPDFKTEAQSRSQRSCRNKNATNECETISDSESSSSSVIEQTYSTFYRCPDCEFSSPQEARYKRHIRNCTKRKLSEKVGSNKLVRDSETIPAPSEYLTFKNCKRCNFKHITIEGLREHYRVVHDAHYTDSGQEISLHCSRCNDTFLAYAGLREHCCGEDRITVQYGRIKPHISSSIMLGTNSSVVFLCPRCVIRFETINDLKDHYNAKTCVKVKLYA